MSKPRLLITINGGIIQHIASNQEVEVIIVDHDNLRDETEETLKELGEIQKQDCIMCNWDMETSITLIKKSYLDDLKKTTESKSKTLLGYQVVDKDNNLHPNMAASFCIYSYDQVKTIIDASKEPKTWIMLPIHIGDIEKPTFMF